jgi:hypothetical protein
MQVLVHRSQISDNSLYLVIYVKYSLAVANLTYQQWSFNLHTGPFFFHVATAPSGPGPPNYRGFTITLRHTTLGRTPLDEGAARRRDLYLTAHNTHKRQISMPPAGFESAIPASEQLQTHALDRTATGIGAYQSITLFFPMARQPYMGLGLLVSSRFFGHTH